MVQNIKKEDLGRIKFALFDSGNWEVSMLSCSIKTFFCANGVVWVVLI